MTSTFPPAPEHEWLMPENPAPAPDPAAAGAPRPTRARLRGAVALVTAGVLAGGGVALAVGHRGTTATTASAAQGQPPGGLAAPQQGQGSLPQDAGPQADLPQGAAQQQGTAPLPGGLPQGGVSGGGLDGEQRLQGTLTRVGSASITVKTASGAATYAVTSATEIVRNGAPATLSQLKVGEQVFVHVYPTGSGSAMAAERIFAGTPPQGGPPQGAPGGISGRDGDATGQPGAGGTTSTTTTKT